MPRSRPRSSLRAGASDDELREVVTRIIEKEGALTEEQAEQRFEDFLKAVSALRDEFKAELAILAQA